VCRCQVVGRPPVWSARSVVKLCWRVCILHSPLEWRYVDGSFPFRSFVCARRMKWSALFSDTSGFRSSCDDDENNKEAITVGHSKSASKCWCLHVVCMMEYGSGTSTSNSYRMTLRPSWPFSNDWPKDGVVVKGGRERTSRRLQEAFTPDHIILSSLPSCGSPFVIDG
jgi:hypothetical protein